MGSQPLPAAHVPSIHVIALAASPPDMGVFIEPDAPPELGPVLGLGPSTEEPSDAVDVEFDESEQANTQTDIISVTKTGLPVALRFLMIKWSLLIRSGRVTLS